MVAVSVPQVRRGWSAGMPSVEGTSRTFILVARGMRYDGRHLELVDLAPTMPYVHGWRPVLGHVTTSAFLDAWTSDLLGPDGEGPWRPCVLALADPTIAPTSDVHLRLARPRIFGTGLRYDASAVGGVLPASSGACVLYVNAGATA
jgi:hypothetical protein